MKSAIKTSIIIPCFNRVDRTAECWKALRPSLADPDSVEVIFVDNRSTDETAKFLAELEKDSGVRVIRNEKNLGFAAACNQGAAQARGEFLVFLNNDIVPLKNWLEPLIELLSSRRDVGVVGARLLIPMAGFNMPGS
jgi:GT2 family glycosyltransferase